MPISLRCSPCADHPVLIIMWLCLSPRSWPSAPCESLCANHSVPMISRLCQSPCANRLMALTLCRSPCANDLVPITSRLCRSPCADHLVPITLRLCRSPFADPITCASHLRRSSCAWRIAGHRSHCADQAVLIILCADHPEPVTLRRSPRAGHLVMLTTCRPPFADSSVPIICCAAGHPVPISLRLF